LQAKSHVSCGLSRQGNRQNKRIRTWSREKLGTFSRAAGKSVKEFVTGSKKFFAKCELQSFLALLVPFKMLLSGGMGKQMAGAQIASAIFG
jgi:hypothetical protein